VNSKIRTTDTRRGNNIKVCFDETWWWKRLVCLRMKTGCWLWVTAVIALRVL
jgi:hypothetical protein